MMWCARYRVRVRFSDGREDEWGGEERRVVALINLLYALAEAFERGDSVRWAAYDILFVPAGGEEGE